jgi:hypothetical protein
MRCCLAFILSELKKVTKNSTENFRIADLTKEKENCKILLISILLGDDICREFRKLVLRYELNESNVDYYPTYKYLCQSIFISLVSLKLDPDLQSTYVMNHYKS